jgi:hypothetical protein
MRTLGLKPADLIRRSGLSRDNVYKYVSGEVKQPRGETLDIIAQTLGVEPLWLKEGAGPELSGYPVVGYVSAGEQFHPVDDSEKGAGMDIVTLDMDVADPVAIQVRGVSMVPVYRDRDVLFCSRQRGADIANCIGSDCVVMTETGGGYLKVLKRGAKAGCYTLESYNRAFPDIEDVRLQWAAPVRIVKRYF